MKSWIIRLSEAIAAITVLNLTIGIPALAANLISNGSFENGNFIGPDPNFTRIAPGGSELTDWTVGGSGVDWHNSNDMRFPFEGEFVLDLNLDGASSGTLSQTFATNPGEFYSLTFYLSGPGINFGFPNPREVQVNIAGIQQTFSTPASLNTDISWQENQLQFEAIGNETTLTFSSVNNAGFWGPVLDEVSVEEVVSAPESSPILCLLALGTIGASSTIFGQKKQKG